MAAAETPSSPLASSVSPPHPAMVDSRISEEGRGTPVAAQPALFRRPSESPGRGIHRTPSRIGVRPGRTHSFDYGIPPSSASTMKSSRPLRQPPPPHEDGSGEGSSFEYDRGVAGGVDAVPHQPQRPELYTRRSVRLDNGTPAMSTLNRPFEPQETGTSQSAKVVRDDTSSRQGYYYQYPGDAMGFYSTPRLDWKSLSKQEKAEVLRLPLTEWMNSNFKNHFVAVLSEFVGTTLFLLFAFAGTEVANIQSQAGTSSANANSTTGAATGFDISRLLYISIIFGFSLMVNAWVFFRVSGGLFNPAVTLGMWLVQAMSLTRAIALVISQILGSMLASVIVRFLFPENFNVRTTLTGGATTVQGVFIEAILTAELVFTIFMLAKEKHRATFIAPVGIGLSLFVGELVGVQFTGGSLNPARSFGPCVVTATFDPEHWIYWVGPIVGALLAVIFYRFIKTLEYEMANPGQDGDPPMKDLEKNNST